MLTLVAVIESWTASDVAMAQQFGITQLVAVDAPWRRPGDVALGDPLASQSLPVRRVTAPPLYPDPLRPQAELSALLHERPRSFVALGPVAATATPRGPWRTATHLLEAAAHADLPVLLSCPSTARRHHTRMLLDRAASAGVRPERIAVHGVDHTNARRVADAGATALLVVGGGPAVDADALAAARDFAGLLAGRLGLAFPMLPGTHDLTAPARLVEALCGGPEGSDVAEAAGVMGEAIGRWLGR